MITFNGLPAGEFGLSIFDVVLRGLTIRGSIVGTRRDLAEALDFYARGAVSATAAAGPFDAVNDIFDRMQSGTLEGRAVLDLSR